MGNVLGFLNLIPCCCKNLDVNPEARFMLDPARDAEELKNKTESLRSSREAVEQQIPELEGRPGEVVRDEVRTWIGNVKKEDEEVSELIKELDSHTRCFRLVCCCYYAFNYHLAEQVKVKIARVKDLQGQHDKWNGNYVRAVRPLPAPEELQEEREKLEDAAKDLQNLVEEQCRSDPSKMPSNGFTTWLRKVDTVASDWQILEQGDGMMSMKAREKHREERIARMRARIRNLLEEGEKIKREGNLAITRPPPRVVNLPGSLPKFLVGVEENVSRVLEQLKDPEVDVIGICGMGGSGKTTLVKEIARRLDLPEPAADFDLVIPVVVSQTPNISKIQEDIGVQLGYSRAKDRNDHPGKPSLPSDLSDRANTLSGLLSKKKILLILDDVWEELDLGRIGVPSQRSANHSKVLLTTRKSDVCGKMGKKLDVGLLSEADSMELFRWKIGMSLQRDGKEKEQIAVEIVRKCRGLPLSIVTIASALKIRSDIETWRSVKDKLERSLVGHVQDMEKDVLKRLKISFDLLPRDEHRSCLLFCALYPEDHNIRISELVNYWIGEGLLEYSEFTEWEDLYGFGRDIVSTLEEACLLERGCYDDRVKLHDAVRDMAIWLGRGGDGYHQHKFSSTELREEDKSLFVDEKWRDLQRVSFHGRYEVEVKVVVPSRDTPLFIGLQTLLLPRHCRVGIPEDFFTLTPNLRVLDMSLNGSFSHIPESLCSVSSLRHLDLCGTDIDHIPESIGCLHSLQYLDLSSTGISNIPKELGKLINLVVLLLDYNRGITSIPRCAVSPLVKLQILGLLGTPCFFLESKQGDEGQLELKDLCNLTLLTRLSLSLKGQLGLKDLCNLTRLIHLSLHLEGQLDVEGLLAIAKAIREIEIRDVSMDELNSLLYGLSFLTVKGQLNSLQILKVDSCNGLKELPSLAHFPNLDMLEISNCTELVQVGSGEESAAVSNSWDDHDTNMHLSLPKLKYIYLYDLPKLASISSVPLHVPSLEYINILNCPSLERPLPMIIPCKLGYGDCDGGAKWDSEEEQERRFWKRGNNVCEH